MAFGRREATNRRGTRWIASAALALLLTGSFSPSSASPHKLSNPAPSATDLKFRKFINDLWPLARDKGVSRETFDLAFRNVTFDARIVANTDRQAEFVRPIWQYLDSAVSRSRVERGRAKADAQRDWLFKAGASYGVDASTIMGIWGMETEFGAFEGSDNVIRALASLAYVHYRGDYFRDELIAALTILDDGDITPHQMVGSWAGAMGQTQFMPSSFLQYAVDFDGEGRRDIWNNPADAIGSTANYLAKHGWIKDEPWGFEVRLPADFQLKASDSSEFASFVSLAKRGAVCADGTPLPEKGQAKLLMPAGLKGPIFAVTKNFDVIKSYNNSTSYALGVALLGDAITDGDLLHGVWPIHDAVLSMAQVRQAQTRLKDLHYEVGEIDGQVGETMRAAVRAYQVKAGLAPDGYLSAMLLRMLKPAH